jgi:putative FmdB family regulatory protein
MPTYDYQCKACKHRWEMFQSIKADPIKKCPNCGKLQAERLIGAGAGILFKGSGFYQTDYRSAAYQKAAEADKKSAEAKSSDGKSSDGKSADKVSSDKTSSESSASKSEKSSTKSSSKAKAKAVPGD